MFYGTQVPMSGNVWNILNTNEMAQLKWMALKNSNALPTPDKPDGLYGGGATPVIPDYIIPGGAMEGDPSVDPSKYYVDPNFSNPDDVNHFYRIARANKAGTDYFHEIFKQAPTTSHNISVSGGGTQGSYLFSFSYVNQQGTLINTYNKRYTLRSNSVFRVGDHIRVGENISFSSIDNPRIGALTEGSAIGMAYRQQPIIPVHDIMGNYASTFSTNSAQLGNAKNPVAIQERTRNNKGEGYRVFGNIFAEADLSKDFTFRTNFGGEIYSGFSHSFQYPEYENSENIATNAYTENSYNGYNWTWSNTLSYHKQIGQHDIRALVGYEAYNNEGRNLGGTTQSYFSFDPNYPTLSNGSGTKTNYSGRYSDALVSYFGRIDYVFMDRYLLGATIRRDGSSKFLNNQFGWFPAVSLGWRISEESFLKNVAWINDLKLRGSYGIMGNQLNVDPNNAYYLFNSDKGSSYYPITGSNSLITEGFRQARIGNPNAKWESDVNANIGVDASLFRNKLEFTIDYYRKDIKDLLYNPELPGTAGAATQPYVNIGKIKSNGIDAAVTGHIQATKDLKFDITGTFTTYNTEIQKIADKPYFDVDSRRFNGQNIVRNAEGHSLSEFYGYQVVGFWNSLQEITAADEQAKKATGNPNATYQNEAALGRFRYKDMNGDGQITADDRTFIGNPSPKFSYGLNLSASYKGFDFSMFLYGVKGNSIWNNIRWWTDFYSSFAGAKSKTALYDSWTPENHNAKAPIQENQGSFSTNSVPNSYYVENGSYLRAKNMMIGYTFPTSTLKRIGVTKFRVYAQAANLFTITKYSGVDPEINSSADKNAAVADFGIDEGAYPNQKQYLIGVNLTF